jgi:hypothetical protein
MNRVALVLVPPPLERRRRQQQQQHATGTMLKISYKAIAMFATVGSSNNAGSSAIFKLFQVRPELLAKRINRPPVAGTNVDSSFI